MFQAIQFANGLFQINMNEIDYRMKKYKVKAIKDTCHGDIKTQWLAEIG